MSSNFRSAILGFLFLVLVSGGIFFYLYFKNINNDEMPQVLGGEVYVFKGQVLSVEDFHFNISGTPEYVDGVAESQDLVTISASFTSDTRFKRSTFSTGDNKNLISSSSSVTTDVSVDEFANDVVGSGVIVTVLSAGDVRGKENVIAREVSYVIVEKK